MILTSTQLRQLTPEIRILGESIQQNRSFSASNRKLSVFLSHKHTDIEYLNRVKSILESMYASVYVDWVDPAMHHPTNRKTAEALKERIRKYDKFIFIASDDAIESKWCNWEIGYGDAQKFDQDKIAIFPIKQDNQQWNGNEYLQLYPFIEYHDGSSKYADGERIAKGFYVHYSDTNSITPLKNWINK